MVPGWVALPVFGAGLALLLLGMAQASLAMVVASAVYLAVATVGLWLAGVV
jgi:hypothetical protein